MKKIFLIVISMILCFTATGCIINRKALHKDYKNTVQQPKAAEINKSKDETDDEDLDKETKAAMEEIKKKSLKDDINLDSDDE
jgi:uncharacterized protein YxeA